mgnify:CR=1 FL=1
MTHNVIVGDMIWAVTLGRIPNLYRHYGCGLHLCVRAEKIFLLEDDAYLRDGLLEMLQGRDYEVESAESIKKAEIIIKENRFSLLIFDVMLSDGSSFDLCERLRAQGVTTPILFLTACDEEYQIVRGLDAGGDDYVTKPFKLLELLSRIRALIRRNAFQNFVSSDLVIDTII